MKILFACFLISLLGIYLPALADEDVKKEETAQKEDAYYFGSIALPFEFFTVMSSDHDPSQDHDPFSGEDEKIRYQPDKGHFVPKSKLPRCLPARPMYYDVADILRKQGISIGKNQWALVSEDFEGNLHLYYCLDLTNADIIESLLMTGHDCGPVTLRHRLTLVSVPSQGLTNVDWTSERLNELSPMVHARYGSVTRSSERTIVTIEDKAHDKYIDFSLSPIRGEYAHALLADLDLKINLNWNTPNAPNINQRTSFTQETNRPFILDCGNHGDDGRNYLLMIESGDFPHLFQDRNSHRSNRIKLKKIDGIYAMNPDGKEDAESNAEGAYKNYSFRCQKGLPDTINLHLGMTSTPGDPFGEDGPSKPLPPATRIKNFKLNKHLQTDHIVFDVTPHFRQLGMFIYENEWVYHNETTSRLITRGTVSMPSRIGDVLGSFNRFPRMCRVNASLVEVKVQGFPAPDWTMDLVTQNQVQHLARYTTTSRSTEKAIFGKEIKRTTLQDTKTGKDVISSKYEFEAESTIGGNSKKIDLRFSLRSQPLGTNKISISVESSLTIPDGKPVIIDLGHPNSGTHTHLLILNADIITTDGSFYRDRLKPVE